MLFLNIFLKYKYHLQSIDHFLFYSSAQHTGSQFVILQILLNPENSPKGLSTEKKLKTAALPNAKGLPNIVIIPNSSHWW